MTVTNITKGETLTPLLVASHPRDVKIFELGASATAELEILAEGGEGYVYIHPDIHGVGDLVPAARDWRNPVAKITIRRLRQPGSD